jgi:hypothetical protein
MNVHFSGGDVSFVFFSLSLPHTTTTTTTMVLRPTTVPGTRREHEQPYIDF